MATMKRCLAQLSLSGRWGTEHFWPGLEVDIDRELAAGFTVGDAVAGRDACFEDVAAPEPSSRKPGVAAALSPKQQIAAPMPHEE